MTRYFLRRLLEGLVLLFIVSVILFAITYSIGDPISALTDGSRPPTGQEADRLRRQLGLDQPLPLQYLYWLIGNDWTLVDVDGDGDTDEEIYGQRQGILRGDFGRSLLTRAPVLDRIAERFPNSLILMVPSYLLVLTLALMIGVYSALRPYSFLDNALNTLAFVGYAMPIYFVCLALIYIFAVQFREWGLPHLPVAGMWDLTQPRTFSNLLRHMILPVASLTIVQLAVYVRYIRSSVLEIRNQDYIRTARAKGLSERTVIGRHVLRPASLPLVTLIGLDLPVILGGAVVTERIFAWPGMGALFIEALPAPTTRC
ncbi:MAG: ABC transporter permease [Chloroflexi bacterium]|nr:ABC transporter permease [Chloroflexota bacterium]